MLPQALGSQGCRATLSDAFCSSARLQASTRSGRPGVATQATPTVPKVGDPRPRPADQVEEISTRRATAERLPPAAPDRRQARTTAEALVANLAWTASPSRHVEEPPPTPDDIGGEAQRCQPSGQTARQQPLPPARWNHRREGNDAHLTVSANYFTTSRRDLPKKFRKLAASQAKLVDSLVPVNYKGVGGKFLLILFGDGCLSQ